ncbi:MAG: hypothetical protein KDI17_18330 [Halioglobus sp.]|nr:hypothetical protein [Halioglobus sp.]
MRRICGILLCFLTLTACGGGGGSGGGSGETVTRSIVGGWGFIYLESTCREAYHFRNDDSMEINSGDEIVSGTYTFQDTITGTDRHKMVINLLADNLGADCLGDNGDDSMSAGTVYIQFDTPTQISWYSDSTGGEPLITMARLSDVPMSEAPYLALSGATAANERDTIQLSADTDALTGVYAWTQVSGPAATLRRADTLTAEVTLPSVNADTSVLFSFQVTLADGSTHSDLIAVNVSAFMDISAINFQDPALAECVADNAARTSSVDAGELTALSCDNVTDSGGIGRLVNLTSLSLRNGALASLSPILRLQRLETLDLSGDLSLPCDQLADIETTLANITEFTLEDSCIVHNAIELGAVGFDAAVDESRGRIYVSVPSRQHIAIIGVEEARIIDTIPLGGEPYGIDISIDGTVLYAAVRGTDSVAVIELDSLTVSAIPLQNQTDSLQLYDVVEGAPNRVFVSARSSFAYIVQIDLAQSNLLTRVADSRIIRGDPRLTRSPDHAALYVSESYSPNSLYKLNLLNQSAPIVLEDNHGDVWNTSTMSVNIDSTRIALGSGQVLRTGSFIEQGRVTLGMSVPSRIENHFFVLDDESNIQIFDFGSLLETGRVSLDCDYGDTGRMAVFNSDQSFMLLQEDVVCIRRPVPRLAGM